VNHEFTYTSADGLALFCREHSPQAPAGTVVCLPGLTRNSRDFTVLASHLADRYRVLTPDLRGRGRSQWDPNAANYHSGIYYQDVLKLLTEFTTGRVAIVGTSLGGILAMLLASTASQRVAGIVLNDVGPEVAPEGLARIRQYVGSSPAPDSWQEAAAQAKANYGQALPDLTDEQWRAYARASYREQADGRIIADYDPGIGDALRTASGTPADLWPLWPTVAAMPVLAIRGALSDILTAAIFDRMLREKPDLLRAEVPRRGHAPLLDEPEALKAIDSFLARTLP
jgi:pimeloyl-ACP methyl ester carboxylesterase